MNVNAKLPPAGTMLLIRVPHKKRGFWVKFLRVETWKAGEVAVVAYIGAAVHKNRKTKEVTIALSETWSFSAFDVVGPKEFTVARQQRLVRVTPHLPALGATMPLRTFSEAAGYAHPLGAYSAVKSLSPEVTLVRGDNGVGVAAPF